MAKSLATTNLRTAATALVLALGVAGGCGSGSNLRPVTGVVLYKGKPLAEAKVMFMSPASARTATGNTNAAGEFTLTTFADRDGAVIGDHKVAVTTFTDEMVAKMNPAQQEAIGRGEKVPGMPDSLPSRYTSFDTSGLTASVKDGEENHFRFELTD